MKHDARELWWALAAIVTITLVYLAVVRQLQAIPAASSLFGHGIGIAGFVLMLATETLYSLRKRSRRARWGRTASWLRFHIFTGLVGPTMVLLHSSWKFNGLAGVVTLLTIIVVVSGFIGRYIYTAVPRTADGLMLEADDLQRTIAATDAELQQALRQPAAHAPWTSAVATEAAASPTMLVLGRSVLGWRQRQARRRLFRTLDPAAQAQWQQMERLLERRDTLRRQAQSLVAARRLLGVWHAVHIPLGMALFAAAFAHIIAAIYFATLLH